MYELLSAVQWKGASHDNTVGWINVSHDHTVDASHGHPVNGSHDHTLVLYILQLTSCLIEFNSFSLHDNCIKML